MLPLPFLIASTGVPLMAFVDDGETKTHGVPPIVLRLTPAKGGKQASFRVGPKTYRLLVTDGILGRSMSIDRNGNGRGDAGEGITLRHQSSPASDGKTVYVYGGSFTLPGNIRYGVTSIASDTRDPGFAQIRDTLRLFPLSGYVGTATFGGKRYRIGIRGTDVAHGYLFVDRDGDGMLGTVEQELFALDKPFSLGGRSYHVASFNPVGRPSIAFAESSVRVAEVPMPADLRVGKIVPPVPGKTLGGKAVVFPKSFAGKLVLLDVWATWCGPCRGEIPFMKAAYAKYRSKGFEICSMSIDDPNMGPQVAAFTKANGMSWTQVFQGRGWQSPVCRRYNITGIPFMLLVDGSTGRILAREDQLRGPGVLDGTVARYVARR